MKDRQPTPGKEGRVRIRLDNGTVIEGVLEMADDALENGTPYNKANVLTDQTAIEIGLTPDATPNDAFRQLRHYMDDEFVRISDKRYAQSTFEKMMTGRLV